MSNRQPLEGMTSAVENAADLPEWQELPGPVSAAPDRAAAWQTPVGRWLRHLMNAPAFYLLAALAGLGIGRMLTPDPRGLGTHEALGLPPCAFQYTTGLPCPGCGMTTAVSHAAHGHWVQSFVTQPAGFLVGVGLWATLPLMLYAGIRRVPAAAVLPQAPRHPLGWGLIIFPIMLLAWAYKIWSVVSAR